MTVRSEPHYYCAECNLAYPLNDIRVTCPCGGLLNWRDDRLVRFDEFDSRIDSLLRYAPAFPPTLVPFIEKISLGEGWTRLVKAPSGMANVHMKLEHKMPTGSFKDRGAVLVVAAALAAGAERIVQDSSGNAGLAVARYASQAGLSCTIYVPESTSSHKVQRIETTGATVQRVAGSRADTTRKTRLAAEEPGTYYASHVFNPLFWEGTKTFLFEVFEQLSGVLPDNVVLPVGNGSLLFGADRALQQLQAAGKIASRPRLWAVQPRNCCPIHAAMQAGHTSIAQVENTPSVATGIAIAAPPRGQQILRLLRTTDSTTLAVTESEILTSLAELVQQGVEVEPTTAANFAALVRIRASLGTPFPSSFLVLSCGAAAP